MTFLTKVFKHWFYLIPFIYLISCGQTENENSIQPTEVPLENKAPEIDYGFPIDSFEVFHGVIARDEFLSDILLRHHVPYPMIHEISERSKSIYDVRKLGRGKKYVILSSKDSTCTALSFIYEVNDVDFVVYDFSEDSVKIWTGKKPVDLVKCHSKGVIANSLYQTLQDSGQQVILAFEMADIFAWTIDFYRLQPGDSYDVLYIEKRIKNKTIGVGRVEAVVFNHEGNELRAYYYEQDSVGGDYFDRDAESLRKAFLKSPLKFSRLTSGFTRRRFHPVQKRWKAHLGTDYAAPSGTPIMSTGDGVIVEATYKRFNGNYVKIRHNSIYMTQYLHMSRIAKGIKPGVYVNQGDVIGYVGSTGLATGPHVCYRFWKHGSQVNHMVEEFPPSEPVLEKNLLDFKRHWQEIDKQFNDFTKS
ncbi:MAG: peptidoglycan DD-metalloendopeptidase family protein [Vicingaceae bacterium]